MQPNPEHAQAFPGSEHTLQPPDVTVIDDLIHHYSVKLPLAGTARWSSAAQLGCASSGAGNRAGPGAGMPGDALQSRLPPLLLSWSSPEIMSVVKETPRDHNPMPDRHFPTLRGTFLHFN